MDSTTLVGEKEASEPRKRLAKLLVPGWVREEDEQPPMEVDNKYHEIEQLAQQHPEVIAKDFVIDNPNVRWNGKNQSQSPLCCAMSLHLPMDTFEAVYTASPSAINAVDHGETLFYWTSFGYISLPPVKVLKTTAPGLYS